MDPHGEGGAMATALAAAQQQQRCEMSLNVPPEFERAIRERVESGAYASPEAVFLACLVALEQWEAEQEAKLQALRRDIEFGREQIRNGQCSPMEELFEPLRARLEPSGAPKSFLQADFDALGAEVQAEVERIQRGEPANQEVVLGRMREEYGDESPPADEFFRRMNAWRIAERIATGKYGSAGDVVHSALCWLEEGEAADAADDELRQAIEEGIRSAETEPLIPGDVAFARIREELRRITSR
jgi:putative addiction module CopG family antidote